MTFKNFVYVIVLLLTFSLNPKHVIELHKIVYFCILIMQIFLYLTVTILLIKFLILKADTARCGGAQLYLPVLRRRAGELQQVQSQLGYIASFRPAKGT